MPELSILMPAYNEAPRIEENLKAVENAARAAGADYEIVVVDDGSQDGTAEAAEKRGASGAPVRVVRLEKNMGKGWALRTGFPETRGQYIAFLDADLDISPNQALEYFQKLKSGDSGVLIASKMHADSHLEYPAHRRWISRFYYLVVWLLFGLPIHDTQTGLKVFRRKVLEQVFPLMLVKRYAFDLELLVLAHVHGHHIEEGPVRIEFRRPWGRLTWRDYYTAANDTLAVFYRLRILRYYHKKMKEREGQGP